MVNVAGIAIGIAIISIIVAIGTLVDSQNQEMSSLPVINSEPIERTIYMNLIEPKGSTNIEKESFPITSLPEGGGYQLIPPDESGKWVVETYVFSPSVIVVNQGDKININMLGINGATHHISIENYVEAFDINRGHLEEISFVADKAGTFRISCSIHQPAMEGYLMVLPNN